MIVALFLLFDTIELLRRTAANPDLSLIVLLGIALLKLPQMVNTVLPFAVMLGSMVVFLQLSRSSEIVVMRAVGVSAWQFLRPVLWLTLLLGLGNITLLNPLGAALYARYLEKVLLHGTHSTLLPLAADLWLHERVGERQSVLHAGQTIHDGQMQRLYLCDVSIFLFKNWGNFVERVESSSGLLWSEKYYKLYDVRIFKPGKKPRNLDILHLPTSIESVQENFSSPETVSVWQLPSAIRSFETAGLSTHIYRLYLQTLIASPFLLCAIVLVAAAFVMPLNHRNAKGGARIVGAISVGFLLYFFSKIMYALGKLAILPLELAAWSPTLLMGSLGLAALFHLEEGSLFPECDLACGGAVLRCFRVCWRVWANKKTNSRA